MDLFSRRVVGWATASHLRTELVLEALQVALERRVPGSDWWITPTVAANRRAMSTQCLPGLGKAPRSDRPREVPIHARPGPERLRPTLAMKHDPRAPRPMDCQALPHTRGRRAARRWRRSRTNLGGAAAHSAVRRLDERAWPALYRATTRCLQHVAHVCQNMLRQRSTVCRMSHKADWRDNAVVDSFFAQLKTEPLNRRSWAMAWELMDPFVR